MLSTGITSGIPLIKGTGSNSYSAGDSGIYLSAEAHKKGRSPEEQGE
jgi:hypothetical protein